MSKDLIILGTSGHAREMAMLVKQINVIHNYWRIQGFVGERGCPVGKNLGSASIIGDDDWLLAQKFYADLVIGVGHPGIRTQLVKHYVSNGRFSFPNLIHPSVIIDETHISMGIGNTISPGCIFTCDISIGNFNHFNYNSTVGHDVKIGDYNLINPGANISGYAQLADRILVGTGAQILQKLKISSDVTIGAGAVVTRNITDGLTVVGVPANPLSKHK